MRVVLFICVFLSGFIAAAEAASPAPGKRVALVIGNSGYKELSALSNPGADAESLAQLLSEHGFDVIPCGGKRLGCFDLTREELSAAMERLRAKARDASLAFVFFVGHGMEAREGNVLAPVDARVDCERHQVARGLLLDEVLEALAGAKQKIIVLDACRNNPLGRICPPATKAKLTFRDFKIPNAGNFLLVSSTKPGQVAADGLEGAHSPFARALLAALAAAPNVHFDQVFNRVSKTVIEQTSKGAFTQIPEMLIRGGAPEDCLAGAACAADPQAAALREELAALRRDRARDQELAGTAKEYLAQIEKQRGKPLSEDERRRELASLKEATRSLAARNDNRGERALEKLKSGDTSEAKRLFLEDLDAMEAEERAEAKRRAERRKKAAASARHIAALARWTNVAEAMAYYRRALHYAPDDAQTWYDYARAARDAGHTDEARAAFEQAARRASGENADSIRYWAINGRGDVLVNQGSLSEALKSFRAGLAIAERLSRADPNNAGWQRDLSVSYIKVGDVLVAQGNLPEALKSFRGSLAIAERLARADPNNAGWQRDLSVSYEKVGDVLVAQGSLADALKSYRDSLAIRDRLARADPNNAGWQRDLAVSHAKLAGVFRRQGEVAQAKDTLSKGREIMQRMTVLSPGNAKWKGDLTWFDEQIAELPFQKAEAAVVAAYEAGKYAKAAARSARLAKAREKAERAAEGKPGLRTASALLELSWYRLFARNFKGALAASKRGIAIRPGWLPLVTNKAHALMFLGRAKAARALYLRYKGQLLEKGGKLWEEVILDDFKEFRKRGLKRRQIVQIERLLGAK